MILFAPFKELYKLLCHRLRVQMRIKITFPLDKRITIWSQYWYGCTRLLFFKIQDGHLESKVEFWFDLNKNWYGRTTFFKIQDGQWPPGVKNRFLKSLWRITKLAITCIVYKLMERNWMKLSSAFYDPSNYDQIQTGCNLLGASKWRIILILALLDRMEP